MELKTHIHNKEIIFLSLNQKDWESELPNKNWLLFIVSDKKDLDRLNSILGKCLEYSPLSICTAGKEGEWTHDVIDEELAYNDTYIPTSWDTDISEALWFACNASSADKPINSIVCIDLDTNDSSRLLPVIELEKENSK